MTSMAWLHRDHERRVDGEAVPEEPLRVELVATTARLAADGGSSSQCLKRLLLPAEPAQLDAGEITGKGYINQRAVRERRAELVALPTADPLAARVVER